MISLNLNFERIKNLFYFLSFFFLLSPFGFLNAQDIGGSSDNGTLLNNPLGYSTITEFIEALLDLVVLIGTPVVVFFVIYSGFLFVTARGNSEKIKSAKTTFLWVVIGAAVVLGALVISTAISGTVDQIKDGSGFGN